MAVPKKKVYSVRRGKGNKLQYALGDARGKQGVKWMPERRRVKYAVRQATLKRQANEEGRMAVGYASDLYGDKRKNGKERRK